MRLGRLSGLPAAGLYALGHWAFQLLASLLSFCPAAAPDVRRGRRWKEDLGQLVPLGFGVATFTPAAYRRHSL